MCSSLPGQLSDREYVRFRIFWQSWDANSRHGSPHCNFILFLEFSVLIYTKKAFYIIMHARRDLGRQIELFNLKKFGSSWHILTTTSEHSLLTLESRLQLARAHKMQCLYDERPR